MKWDKLRFVGASNVDLPVIGADPSGPFILKGVDGLDPPPIDVLYAKVRGQRGVRQNKEPQYRQIVALVGLQPNWDTGQTSSDLRTQLYGLLTPKYGGAVTAQVMLGNTVVAQAVGDVSNMDASIFSKDPEVQITLDCDGAYLLSPTAVVSLPTRTVAGGITTLETVNPGDAPSGFLISFTLQQSVTTLQLYEDTSNGRMMEIEGPFAAGDTIIIDTRPGTRNVQRILSGQTNKVSLLNNLNGSPPWLMLHGGINKLKLNATLFDWQGSGFTYLPAYWGV